MSPIKILVLAGLLLSFTQQVTAINDCKPKIDKGVIVVELGIPNFNGGKRVVMSMPVKVRESLSGGGGGIVPASFNHSPANGVSYNLYISEKRKNGVVLELSVNTKARDNSNQVTRKTIFIPHERIIEQQYLNGVQVKAYFKLRPFHCKSI